METSVRVYFPSEQKRFILRFLKEIWVDANSRGRPTKKRDLVSVLGHISIETRREIQDPYLKESVRKMMNSLSNSMLMVFKQRQDLREFLIDFFGGEPYFEAKVGETSFDILAKGKNDFTIWLLHIGEDGLGPEERRQALFGVVSNVAIAERYLAKPCKGIVLFDGYHLSQIDLKQELLAKAQKTASLQNEATSDLSNAEVEQSLSDTAVIIVDVEGQFENSISSFADSVNRINKELGNGHRVKVEVKSVPQNTCLTLDEIELSHLTYFTPTLTVKSVDQFRIALDKIGNPSNPEELFRELEFQIEKNQVMHISIRKALGSSLSLRRVIEKLFDKELKQSLVAEELLVPGKITILDVSTLDEVDQRYVAIYLLAILERYKMARKDSCRAVVVFDEAHKMFPKTPPKAEKDYMERIANFVKDIVHRGRKRRYGIIIATQSPTDVSKDIANLCDTKMIFELGGQSSWVREHVNDRAEVSKVRALRGVGIAYIICGGTRLTPQRVKIPHIMNQDLSKPKVVQRSDNSHFGTRVGKVIQREKYPLHLSNKDSRMVGYVYSDKAALILPNQIVLAKRDDNGVPTQVPCKVEDIKSYMKNTSIEEAYASEFVTYVGLAPLSEKADDGYEGALRNQDMANFGLYIPTERDIRNCYNLPNDGIPLGTAIISEASSQCLTFFFPYNPSTFKPEETEWLVDHSIFIVGSQGRGKTNLIVYLSTLIACRSPKNVGERFCHP